MDLLTLFNFGVWTVLLLILLSQLVQSIRMVPQRYAYIVERLGRYHVTLDAGFHTLIPFFDRVSNIVDLKEETIDVPPQECFTKDEIKVVVDGVLYLSVLDPVKASYGVTDYKFAAVQLAQTTTRSVLGKIELDRTFEEREMISARVVEVLGQVGAAWGIHVHRYEIKNIQPPSSVQQSMEKQVTAERDRQAILAKSLGDRQARINRSEGRKQEMINKSEGERQKRINEAEGLAAEIKAIAEATAISIEKVAAAIVSQNGEEALRLNMSEKYLSNLGKLASNRTELILPMDLSKPDEILENIGLGRPG
jgi:regulator of protease activity HflC (stomatin/prohibitin superfamily)